MLLQKIKSLLPTIFLSNQLLLITVNHFLVILNFLKNNIHYQFNSLQTIVGIDYINTTFRFALVYQLYSYTNKQYLNLKIFIPLKQKMESLTPIFINANWFEREIWDLFGIFFKNHPDLRRILTDYAFEGHPLRKDFPLTGFFETNFLEEKGGLVWHKLTIAQKSKF